MPRGDSPSSWTFCDGPTPAATELTIAQTSGVGTRLHEAASVRVAIALTMTARG
jgi:hypothetical protein